MTTEGSHCELQKNTTSIESLVENNRALTTLLNTMRDMVLYCDCQGVVRHINARAAQWWGEQSLGKAFVEIALLWDDPQRRQREIQTVADSGKPLLDSHERVALAGREYWFSVDKIPTRGLDNRVDGVMLVVSDITECVRREMAAKESEARYKAYIASSVDAIWRYDFCPPIDIQLACDVQEKQIYNHSVLAECNHRLAQYLGVDNPDDLLGSPLSRSGSPDIAGDIALFVSGGYRFENLAYSLIDKNNHVLSFQSNAIGIVENGYLTRVWGTTRDVTDQCLYTARLEYMANHDTLTELPNRNVLYSTVNKAIEGREACEKMALMLIDLDRFKEINDTLGHLVGDKLLKQLGPRLKAPLQDIGGLVARLGGDEFAIFLPTIDSVQQALLLAHKLLDSISAEFELEGFRTQISASIGVAICPDQATDAGTLMRFADVAMYRAKTALQGVSVYDSAFDPHSPKRLELMGALGRATRENELVLYYQPKICFVSNRVYGFEALLRWHHPDLGLILPGDFISIAEHSNLIYHMTLWVLEQGIRQCRAWQDQGLDLTIAVNLCARNLSDDRIVLDLKRLLKQYSLPGNKLELEITESMMLVDPVRAQAALERINSLGVRLAVDDFGTGYSSLANLRRLPVQVLKIDASFVMSMLHSDQDEIIVKSTINLAHNLGLYVIAEGVENKVVYNRLASMGCDGAQGYYMAKPMPIDKVAGWLRSSRWHDSVLPKVFEQEALSLV